MVLSPRLRVCMFSVTLVLLLASLAVAGYAASGGTPQSYILITNAPLSSGQLQQLRQTGATIAFTYQYLPGAAIQISPQQLPSVRSLGFVSTIVEDGIASADVFSLEVQTASATTDHTYNLDLINAEASDAGTYTGRGVYVAVLDTGLVTAWRDFLPAARVDTVHAIAFVGSNGVPNYNQWQYDTGSHGTAVAATIVGYTLHDDSSEGGILAAPVTGDASATTFVRGVAPEATIIPVKVLTDAGFGFWSQIIAGIDYVTGLVSSGGPLAGSRVVINMSLGGSSPNLALERSIEHAVAAGIPVVAAAGNSGNRMDWPGAYPIAISAGAVGFRKSFGQPSSGVLPSSPDNTWWMSADIAEGQEAASSFIASFSSKENQTIGSRFTCDDGKPCIQELDIVAPGRRVLLPFPCSNGVNVQGACGSLANNPADPFPRVASNPPTYLFVSGTSFSSPHTAGVVALLLQKNPALTPAQVQTKLTSTATLMASSGTFLEVNAAMSGFNTHAWDNSVNDATGAGLLDAKDALAAA